MWWWNNVTRSRCRRWRSSTTLPVSKALKWFTISRIEANKEIGFGADVMFLRNERKLAYE
jgi:hypothetical protein